MRALLALPFVLLAACGEDAKSPSPEAPGNKAEQAKERLKEQGFDVGELQRKVEEIQSRSAKPLTDADVELYLKVYPEWVAARADPAAHRAVLVKHDTDLITWSQIGARVGAAYAKLKRGVDVPGANPADLDVVKRHLADVEKAMTAAPGAAAPSRAPSTGPTK